MGWAVALLGVTGLLVLAASPGWLAESPGAMIRYGFSFVCHQIPDRSPHLNGDQLALCHRCSGILLGLALGVAATIVIPPRVGRRALDVHPVVFLTAAGLPTAVDWLLGATGVWPNTPVSRILTGVVLGLAAGLLVGRSLLAPPPQPTAVPSPNLLA